MRYLTSIEWRQKGQRNYPAQLPVDKENFQPVAIMAFPAPVHDEEEIAGFQPALTATMLHSAC